MDVKVKMGENLINPISQTRQQLPQQPSQGQFSVKIAKELGYNEDGDVAFMFYVGQRDQRYFGVQGELIRPHSHK